MSEQKPSKQRLRKQPNMRRVYSTAATPLAASVPKTARKRKRRNSTERIRRPLGGVMRIVLSTRWISLAILGLCVYALYMIGHDERYYLSYIPVQGTSSIQPASIVEQSGLAGHHIFAADPQEAADQIRKMNGIITATVTLHWPNEVLVQVREKPPLATWQEGDQTYWIDENGQLTPARAETVGLLTIVSEASTGRASSTSELEAEQVQASRSSGDEATDEQAGSRRESGSTEDSEATQPGHAAFVPRPVLDGALLLRQMRPNIDRLYYDPGGGLSYQDGRGWRAYFGTGLDMNQKLVVYETVVDYLLQQGLNPQYISVSNQKRPFYRLAP